MEERPHSPARPSIDDVLTESPRRSLALAFVLILLAVGVVATPFAKVGLFPVPGYMLAFGTTMVVTNLILASLLLSRGNAEGDRSATQLGAVYLFVGLIFFPMTASFPGALSTGALIGTTYSAVWIWSLWHAGFGLGIINYCISLRTPRAPVVKAGRVFAMVTVVVTLIAIVSTVGVDYLPQVFGNPASGMFSGRGEVVGWLIIAIDTSALALTLRLKEKTPECLWLSVAMVAACFDVWLTFRSGARFSVGWYLGKVGSLATTMVVLVSLVNNLSVIYRRIRVANAALAELANRDGLTGLANRRSFDLGLDSEARRALRHTQDLSLLMIDVDHFKLYNDRYGHQQGDECLRAVAAVIASNAKRPGDVAARYGGEEFAILLPATDLAGARLVGTRILDDLARLGLAHLGQLGGLVTLSIGVASSDGRDTQVLVRTADQALYKAKRSGRNCIRSFDPMVEPPAYVEALAGSELARV